MKTIAAAFIRDERGSAVLEFCLWLPLFMFFLAAIVDASVIYLTHTSMWSAARDTARRVTTGQINPNDLNAISEHIEGQLSVSSMGKMGKKVKAQTYHVDRDYDPGGGTISITVGTLIGDASVFGIFGVFANESYILDQMLESTVEMKMEPK